MLWARRASLRLSAAPIRAIALAAAAIALSAVLLVQPWVHFSYLLSAVLKVLLGQKHWMLSVAAVAVLLWYQRGNLTRQSALLVLGYYASFLALAVLIAYMANYLEGETFGIWAPHHLRLYLTDPSYRIMGPWSRSMIALYPALLLLVGLVPAFSPRRVRDGVTGLAEAMPPVVAGHAVPGSGGRRGPIRGSGLESRT